jgi:hypothetical protein
MNPEQLTPSSKKGDSAEAQGKDMRYALVNRPSPPF